jgi:hypothetical protein
MESFWFFNMNGVAVAATSEETYRINGEVVKPVKKIMVIKPGVICSVIGPYEGVDQYMRFVRERFKLNPKLTIKEVVEDIRWMISKKEVDGNEINDAIKHLAEILKNPDKYDVNEELDKLMEIDVMRKLFSSDGTDEESKKERERQNLYLNQVRLIESLPHSFNIHTLVIDPSTNEVVLADKQYKHDEPPEFQQWGLQQWKPGTIEFGQVILDMQKEYKQTYKQFTDNAATVKLLCQLIAKLDQEHNPQPVPLMFMESGSHTGWEWAEVKN